MRDSDGIRPFLQGFGVDFGCGLRPVTGATYIVDHDEAVCGMLKEQYRAYARDVEEGFADWEDSTFDFTYSFGLLENLRHPLGFLDECYRLTRPGGFVIIGGPHLDRYQKALAAEGVDHQAIVEFEGQWLVVEVPRIKRCWLLSALDYDRLPRSKTFIDKTIWPVNVVGPPYLCYRKLSIVIAVHGQRALTQQCLFTLFKDVPDAEVIIVDNASPDDTLDWLKTQSATVIANTENRGVAPAWNQGLARATGDVLGVLNNDTIIRSGGMKALAKLAWKTGIACFDAGVLTSSLSFSHFQRQGHGSDYPSGCALFFRRDVWSDVGCFDEGMILGYCEDSDWGLRAREKGYGWETCPDALIHLGSATARTVEGLQEAVEHNISRLRARWRHKGEAERLLIQGFLNEDEIAFLVPVLRALRQKKPLAYIHLQTSDRVAILLKDFPLVDVVGPAATGPYTQKIELDNAYYTIRSRQVDAHPTQIFANILDVSVAPSEMPA